MALLEFAEKLTAFPSGVTAADTERLREAGFADEEILDATLIISLFNFMNRLTHALGLTGEEAHGSHSRILPSPEP